MPNNYEYFRNAALVLVGSGTAKQRLIDAYNQHLCGVEEISLPEQVRRDFNEFADPIRQCRKTGNMTPAEVLVRKMSEPEAVKQAQAIVDMFVALCGRRPVGLELVENSRQTADDFDQVPAFLSRA